MSVLDVFFGTGNDLHLDTLGAKARQRLDPWIERWRDGRGPAFLPRTRKGRVFWYGLTNDDLQRREVQQLLRHWVGPACSDVVERQGALDLSDPFDRDLDQLLPQRVVRLEVWPRTGNGGPPKASREKVRDRLEYLVSLLDERPVRDRRTAVSLPALLDELDLAATSGESQRAHDLLKELEDRRLLDAPNTTFARIRVEALLGRHDQVLESQLIQRLEGLRVPPGVVLNVARAVYHLHLAAADTSHDAHELLRQREELPIVLRHVLRQGAATTERPVAVSRAVVAGDEAGMSTLLAKVLPDEPHLQALLGHPLATCGGQVPDRAPGSVPSAITEPAERDREDVARSTAATSQLAGVVVELTRLHHASAHQAVIDIARDVERLPRETHELIVLSADELDTDRAARDAISIVERDLGSLDSIEWPTSLIRRVVEGLAARIETGTPAIGGWEDWFLAVSSGMPVNAEWEQETRDWMPLPPDRLLELIEAVEDARPMARVLGSLLAAHEHLLDPSAKGVLARHALMVLALSDRSDQDVRLAGRELVVAVLDSGVASEEVDDLFETVLELVRMQLSIGTLPWAIDLMVELTGALAITAKDALVLIWHRFFDLMRVFAPSVSRARWLEIRTVTEQVQLELPPDLASRLADDPGSDPLGCFAGKRVLLYSLRERAARQAAARLHASGAHVDLSTAHVGSPRLAGQIQGADVVVIVTAAAKHAATDFIESACGKEPIRVNSAGMSGIMNSMEEYCGA